MSSHVRPDCAGKLTRSPGAAVWRGVKGCRSKAWVGRRRDEARATGMDRFVSTFINKIDAKGRVSVPAPFRAVLERDGYAGGIYCYPSLDAPALDAGGQRLAENI